MSWRGYIRMLKNRPLLLHVYCHEDDRSEGEYATREFETVDLNQSVGG
jgi:hypothetical protein